MIMQKKGAQERKRKKAWDRGCNLSVRKMKDINATKEFKKACGALASENGETK
jgi:hypothetical protein